MSNLFRTRVAIAASMFAILATQTSHVAAQNYSYTDLGAGVANAINDAGQIVGINNTNQAVLWDGTTTTVLAFLGHYDDATGINSAGQVAGFYDANCGCTPQYNAVQWNGGVGSLLANPQQTESIARGINNSGATVGYVYSASATGNQNAVIWSGTQTIELGTTNSQTYSEANGINNSGQEVGYFYQNNGSGMQQAVLWNGTTPTVLGTLGSNTSSDALALNDKGQEVGYSNAPGPLNRSAVVWNGTAPTVLASLGGTNSVALGINNAGEAVGYSYLSGNTVQQAVLWVNGKVINLNSYLPGAQSQAGWVLEEATGINNSGVIVGEAQNTITGQDQAFSLNLVAAVPEPGHFSMLLSGLGLIGFIARRRKNANSKKLID